jgi:hypothetical protein
MRLFIVYLIAVFLLPNHIIGQQKQLDQESFYSAVALTKLKHTSDSLHIRYKSVPHNKTYFSLPQAHGNWVFMDTLAKEARDFVKTKPSFDAFLRKFPFAKVEKNLLVLRYQSEGYGNGKIVQFRSYPEKYPYEFDLSFDSIRYFSSLKNTWIDTILEAHIYRKNDEFVGCFFEKGFETKTLPTKYAQKIEYVDFISDTNTVLFPYRNILSSLMTTPAFLPARKALYALLLPNRGARKEGDFDYEVDYAEWVKPDEALEQNVAKTADFKKRLVAASDEALVKKIPSALLENLVLKYLSPAKALKLKQLRYLNLSCGNDNRPRFHWFHMAKLAAETNNWNIFMSAYLTLLQTPFDGGHTKKQANFYTHQLELIDVNVTDLLFGGLIYTQNEAKNHFRIYHFQRMGFIIDAYSQSEMLEKQMIESIGDAQLDDYNRYSIWKIYENTIWSRMYDVKTEEAQNQLKIQLKQKTDRVKALLPYSIASRIKEE